MRFYLPLLLALLSLSACQEDNTKPAASTETNTKLTLTATDPPITLSSPTALFYKNISYGPDSRNVFDIFVPNTGTPAALCIYIHGGGFVSGDKLYQYYNADFGQLTNTLLANNIAVASINYRFIQEGDTEGVIKCLNDAKLALQFMRYHSSKLAVNQQKVVLIGSSAGAGTSLWLGFQPDMADNSNDDPILQESTRVQGVVATATQATYDLLAWPSAVFNEYQAEGFGYTEVEGLISQEGILNFYGAANANDLNSNEITAYRQKVDMLALLTADDPEFYAANTGVANTKPTTTSALYHHPLHVRALQERASQAQAAGIFYSPELNLDTTNGESIEDFIIRKLSE